MTQDTKFVESILRSSIGAHQQGRLEDADRGYTEILARFPDHADALHLSGLVAFQRGALHDAKNCIERAIQLDAAVQLYHANLGRIAMAMEDYQAALDAWSVALALSNDAADIHSDMAGAFIELARPEEALSAADKALEIDANHALALLNRGLALSRLLRFGDAALSLQTSASLQPENPEVWFQLGQAARQAKHLDMAERAYGNTVRLQPEHMEGCNNLGNILRDQLRFDEAIDIYRQAIALNPSHSDLHSNLGVALQECGDTDAAVTCYREAVRLEPTNAEAHRNLGMGLLQQGEFAEGWAEYEWRWQTRHFEPIARHWKMPRWQGEEVPGKTLLVHCEQGFGDCLQFARYLTPATGKVDRLIVEAPDALAALFARIDGVEEVVITGSPLPACDFEIPLMSMPQAFQTTLETIPTAIPYLEIDREKAIYWQGRLDQQSEQKLVGVVWSGSGAHPRNLMRSPGLAAFAPLFKLDKRVRFVSLQKDEDVDANVAGSHRIEDFTGELTSFDDTAALISQLDVVIAPDTAVTHLAGALGVRTFLALPKIAEWRWLNARDDSPWYPNTRLVRQSDQGDWSTVFQSIARELS